MGFKEAKIAIQDTFGVDVDKFKPSISGSKVKKSDIGKFAPKNLLSGIRVEFEHTDDPMMALEITLAHLNEKSNYYDLLKKYVEK